MDNSESSLSLPIESEEDNSKSNITETNDEVQYLVEINRQLKAELAKINKEYNHNMNVIPNLEKLYSENNVLKKEVMELKSLNDDLTKRLDIALQANSEIKTTKETSNSKVIKDYENQISDLQVEVSSLISENENLKQNYQKQMKTNEVTLHSLQSENSVMSTNLSKLLKAAQVRFNQSFQSPSDLAEYLKKPIEPQSKSSEDNEIEEEMKNFKEKISALQEKLFKEKQKVKTLQIGVMKLKKKSENDLLKFEQEKTQLNDTINSKENEIKRLTIINQQKLIVKPPPKTKSMAIQVSTIIEDTESEGLKHELNRKESLLHENETTISMLKMDLETKTRTIHDLESTKDQIMSKLKNLNSDYEKVSLELNRTKKQNEKLAKEAEEALTELAHKAAESALPKERLEGEIAKLRLERNNYEKTIQHLESLLNHQKEEIVEFSTSKEKLIAIIEKQSQIFAKMDELNQNMYNRNKKLEADLQVEREQNENTKKKPQQSEVEWNFGDLPVEIFDIVNEIASNASLTVESRVKNIFMVVNKYIQNQSNLFTKEKEQLNQTIEDTKSKLEDLQERIITSLSEGDENELLNTDILIKSIAEIEEAKNLPNQKEKPNSDITTDNAPDMVSKYIVQCRIFLNEIYKLKKEKEDFLNEVKQEDFGSVAFVLDSLIQDNQKLSSQIKEEKKKRANMRSQVTKVISVKEKESEQKEGTLKKMNEEARNQIDQLQTEIRKLQDQNHKLIDQLHSICEASEKSSDDESSYKLGENESTNTALNRKEQQQFEYQIESLNQKIESLNKSLIQWKEISKHTQEELAVQQKKTNDVITEYENKIDIMSKENDKEKEDFVASISQLNDKLISEQNKYNETLAELTSSLSAVQLKYDNVCVELNKQKFEAEKVNMNASSKIEQIERSKKLAEAQLKAKILSLNSNYSIQILEEKQKSESEKRNLIEYFIKNFKDFADIRDQLDENCFKDVIQRLRAYLEKCQTTESAMRKLIKAKDEETTEDALTQFIIRMHPQFKSGF